MAREAEPQQIPDAGAEPTGSAHGPEPASSPRTAASTETTAVLSTDPQHGARRHVSASQKTSTALLSTDPGRRPPTAGTATLRTVLSTDPQATSGTAVASEPAEATAARDSAKVLNSVPHFGQAVGTTPASERTLARPGGHRRGPHDVTLLGSYRSRRTPLEYRPGELLAKAAACEANEAAARQSFGHTQNAVEPANDHAMEFDVVAQVLAEMSLAPAGLPSAGSAGHAKGLCKPCAFVFKGGCQAGVNCRFCHLCEEGEKKRRKREHKAAKRALKQHPMAW